MLQGKFVIYNVQPFIGGGLFLQVTFFDDPAYLFDAWVYSDVDIESKTVTGYHVQNITKGGYVMDVTQEDLMNAMA